MGVKVSKLMRKRPKFKKVNGQIAATSVNSKGQCAKI